MTRAYYNELDPFAAQWLRNLIAEGLIADGDVDERSIEEVQPDDLKGYCQCHFFAGIGGWSYALRLAGWPDDRAVWTGSCPCQPFSTAGRAGAEGDERHLWPAFYRLIESRRPAIVFGEQVASSLGRAWLAGVRADLGSLDYAVGAADLCAAGVGAPHIRQRLYWMGLAEGRGVGTEPITGSTGEGQTARGQRSGRGSGENGGRLADAEHQRAGSGVGQEQGEARCGRGGPANGGTGGVALGDTEHAGLEGHAGDVIDGHEPGRVTPTSSGSVGSPGWDRFNVVRCIETARQGGEVEKWRRVEPGTFPLAHGIPARVGRLRGYGNAIVPQVAAEFIRASVEAIEDLTTITASHA